MRLLVSSKYSNMRMYICTDADGAHVVTGALLFPLEFHVSAFLSGRRRRCRSPLPAGHGSRRSDLHLSEVEGCQVALPRLPVHSLTARAAD